MKLSFHSLLFKTFHAHRNQIRPYMQDIGLSSGQPKVLAYLLEHEDAMQKDVAKHCDIEPATVSKMLEPMEKKQLIIRKAVAGNRRAGCISISEKGKTAYETWNVLCSAVEEKMLQDFSEQERLQFISFLSRSYYNLTNNHIE